MVNVAVSAVAVEGRNVTVTVQGAPGARDEGQSLTSVKSAAFGPEATADEMSSASVPELVIVTVCGVPGDPATTVPKFKGVVSMEPLPVPVALPVSASCRPSARVTVSTK